MRRLLQGTLALTLFSFAAPACDETRPIAPIRDGKAECESIGTLCHDPGDRFGGRYAECHEIGHVGEGKACIRAYDECFALCKAAPSGEGGAGGESHGAGGAHAGEGGAGGESHGAGGAHAGEGGAAGTETAEAGARGE